MIGNEPRILVFSTLFPHPGQPNAGLFIRERVFRLGKRLPLVVVAPVPWFPLQGIIRRWRPHFRPPAPAREVQDSFDVYHPRFFSVPGIFKSLDGFFMALGSLLLLRRLHRQFRFNIIDAHFAYPDGYAACLLGKWLRVPVTVTLRGTEVPLSKHRVRRRLLLSAIARARRVFAVSESLRAHVSSIGADSKKILVVGNGVDTGKFHAMRKQEARADLGIPVDAPVLISVGALVERKGFQRVIEILPGLQEKFPSIKYLIVGGPSPEGDIGGQLRQMVVDLGLNDAVKFLGPLAPGELRIPLSAADVFVLATGNEGWANVFLEAMACGLPVVTTDVGGNREVVCKRKLGIIVPIGDVSALRRAVKDALEENWDREVIIAHADANTWDERVNVLESEFRRLVTAST